MALSRLTKQHISAEDVNKMTRAELEKYIKNAAKKSNMSLRDLEKTGFSRASRAYRYAKKNLFDDTNLMSYNKKGQKIFRTSVRKDETVNQLRHRASRIANFRNAPSHTSEGVKKQYKKAYESWVKARAKKNMTGEYTRAQLQAEEKRLKTEKSEQWFGEQWGAFTEEQYKFMQRGSDTVAVLINEGYTADQIVQAIESIEKDAPREADLDRYRDIIKALKSPDRQLGDNKQLGD